jgi:hypothetical protein
LTATLNPALSNGAWAQKQPEIAQHSKLHLNTQFIDQSTWNEHEILMRGRNLAEIAVEIWPPPDRLLHDPALTASSDE